jgi:hypothetical protein
MARAITLVAVLAAACGSKKSGGLDPASDWNADQTGAVPAAGAGPAPHSPHVAMGGGDPNDPHAGVDMGPAADQNDPHAGVDMQNPHAGGGVDVTKMGLPTPDPNRPIDPTHRIRGVIKVDPKVKAHLAAGGAVFLIAKQADPSGNPAGPPLAVQKLNWKDDLAFELTEANAMVGGTQLAGDVVVTARYDQDGDALSKQPGDVTGQLRVKVPADNVKLMLDSVLP